MPFLVQLALFAVLSIGISLLTAQKPPKQEKQKFEPPVGLEGTMQGIAFGTVNTLAVCIDYKDISEEEIKSSSGKK